MKKLILTLICTMLLIGMVQAAWWDGDYSKRKEIDIIGGISTLNNFTIFLNVSYESSMQTDFDDLRFINGACSGAQTEELKYEIDYKVDSNYAHVWVKIPTLTSGTNNICMYYGNAGASNGQDPANTWDDLYTSVWHFNDSSVLDSKGNYNAQNVFGSPSFINTNMGRAFQGDGTDNSINLSNSNILIPPNTDFTLEFFTHSESFSGDQEATIAKGINGGTFSYRLGTNKMNNQPRYYNDISSNGNFASGGNWWESAANTYTSGWQTLVREVSGENGYMYGNKSLVSSGDLGDSTYPSNADIYICLQENDGVYCSYAIDEMRISNTSRSSAWINRSVDNLNYSSFSFGAEEENARIDVNLISPINNLHVNSPTNYTVNISTDQTADNATLWIYNSTNDVVEQTTLDFTDTNDTIIGIVANLSDEGEHTWYYEVETTQGGNQVSSNRTIISDFVEPLINWFDPTFGSITTTTALTYTINATVQDTYLDAVNVSVYRSGSWIYTNEYLNLTVDQLNVTDTVTLGKGINTVEISGRDSLSESPKIRDFTTTNRNFPDDVQEYFDIDYNGVEIRRSTYVVNNGGNPIPRADYDLVIEDTWDSEGEHIKTDITTDKLQNQNWGVRIDFECLDGCDYMELLVDRERVRIVDQHRNLYFHYEDAISEGWDIQYQENEGIVSVIISYPDLTFFNAQPARHTIDPITGGLNQNSKNVTIISDSEVPVVTLDPTTGEENSATTIDVQCIATDDGGVSNVSVYVDGSLSSTGVNTVENSDYTYNATLTLAEGDHTWYCVVTDQANNIVTSSSNTIRQITRDTPAGALAVCEESGVTFTDAAALAGIIFVIILIGLVLVTLVLAVTGVVDVGKLGSEVTLENAAALVAGVGLLYLVIATMAFLIINGVCSAYVPNFFG